MVVVGGGGKSVGTSGEGGKTREGCSDEHPDTLRNDGRGEALFNFFLKK